jgi:hypothetical protein
MYSEASGRLDIMPGWDLDPPHEPPALSRDEAIEIALSDPMTSPELRDLPVDAEYGAPIYIGVRGGHPDVWKVSVDVSSLGWDMEYEGPGPAIIRSEIQFPQHVRVPNVRAVIILVDDKTGRRTVSGTEPEPDQEHRVEWQRTEGAPTPSQEG